MSYWTSTPKPTPHQPCSRNSFIVGTEVSRKGKGEHGHPKWFNNLREAEASPLRRNGGAARPPRKRRSGCESPPPEPMSRAMTAWEGDDAPSAAREKVLARILANKGLLIEGAEGDLVAGAAAHIVCLRALVVAGGCRDGRLRRPSRLNLEGGVDPDVEAAGGVIQASPPPGPAGVLAMSPALAKSWPASGLRPAGLMASNGAIAELGASLSIVNACYRQPAWTRSAGAGASTARHPS